MKKIFLIAAIFFSALSEAQIRKITLQASGLTCSMCSNAISKSLKSLDAVEQVNSLIQSSSFEVIIKPGREISFDLIRKKVEDAGFFVARMEALISFDHVKVVDDSHVSVAGMIMHFLNSKSQELNGEHTVRILDKGFVTAKEFKKGERYTAMSCYKTGVAGSCCSTFGLKPGTRIYHVSN
jgi:copper chaperone CopZ